jgi:HD-like signal output (HDOD) protein
MNQGYIPAFTLEPPKPAAPTQQAIATRTPRFIDDVAAGRVVLPTIPSVVQQLIAVLRDPHVDARRIGEALSRDPVLTAKVLRVANSSYFGGQRSMASIGAAVAMIGTQALNKLIVACGVASTFDAMVGIDLPLFWRDAWVAASAASKLAPGLAADAEEAYLCGLLHATGHLILCRSYPDIASAMFTGFEVVRGEGLATIETDAFGIDHPAVGALWAESLGFPQPVVNAIGGTLQAHIDTHEPLDIVLRSACALARAVVQNDTADIALAALPPKVRAQWAGPDGQPNAAFSKLCDELQKAQPMP